MKKKILGGLLVVAIAAVAAFNMNMNMNTEKNEMSALMLANVEALASGEGEVGIGVQQCVFQGFVEDSNSAAHYTLCNSSTTSNTIYKCPSNTKQGKIVGLIKYGTCYK